jgi:hypothetical protein
MISDLRATFATAASVAAAAGTALLTNQMDMGVGAGVDVDDLYLVIQVTTGIITGGSAGKIRFALASGDTAAIPVDGTAAVHYQTGDFTTGSTAIAAGSVLAVIEIPRGSGVLPAYKRFLGVLSIITTTTVTAGAVSAFLTPDGARWAAIAQAVN